MGPATLRPVDPRAGRGPAGLRSRGLGWPRFGRDDFPLPTLSGELTAVLDELEHGRWFVVLQGLPVARYADEELKNLAWGLGAHLGHIRHQNASGELIGEVRSEVRRYGEVQEPALDAALGRLAPSNSRPLPPGFEVLWGTTEAGAPRGGIQQPRPV